MLGQNMCERPDVVESVIKWSGRYADDVGFAKIAFHTGDFELL
jgi:hypothetical protein